ncbi:hypothetical protein [Yoonia sediminilitoris]|uniref:Uncharacterized protein n=1 Tax=Yoonia sediminilitoris TaxID=1286148 RepID=A0A2T6KCV5_9RHOB|nr:hypothetical protein [Yoonia sediminilitoris]PUB12777.1 hypothetical protein C8N45_10985 [Yoonia sediminilitoris]RCW94256.1 hypothetical protein DFP92_10985 [Yoonia sediminilitoris]
MANLDLNDFKMRVKRIQDPRNNAYFDQELGMHVPKHTTPAEIQKAVKSQRFSVMRLVVSLMVGVAAVMAAQAIRLRYLEMTDAGIGSLFTDLLLTTFFVLLVSALIRHRRPMLRLCQIGGVAAMFVAGHNLMWFYPDQLAVIYTPEHVASVQAETEPMTIVLPAFTAQPQTDLLDT